jgi:hypothetical protein
MWFSEKAKKLCLTLTASARTRNETRGRKLTSVEDWGRGITPLSRITL